MSPNKLLYKLVSNKLETFKISEIVLIIDIQLTPSNSARLVPSEIGSRLDASNQASGVRLLKCTTRGKREGEGERYRQRTTALLVVFLSPSYHLASLYDTDHLIGYGYLAKTTQGSIHPVLIIGPC